MKLERLFEAAMPRRFARFGVGKRMGNDLYFHRMYQEEIIPAELLAPALELLGDFPYNIVKFNDKNGNITFVQSPDWDANPEPVVGEQVLVKQDGSVRQMRPSADPWIYHHKWLFVRDDYPGFDVEESKARSQEWMSLPDIDYRRIGKKSFWEQNVLPQLN